MQDISKMHVRIFKGQNKYLPRYHFYSKAHRNMNLHEYPQASHQYCYLLSLSNSNPI